MTHEAAPLLTETELAERIRIAVPTLRRWRWSGDGPPFVRVGRCVRYDPAHVRTWLDERTRRSTSDTGAGAA
ncbi:MAG: helix-turn-helix domain-containing protein [Deltaproteobacteria bacterium]|nr:helix-turn-helix domain-containing protein [Deltaproteobacteria bacterium]